jgi:hypothetical protein
VKFPGPTRQKPALPRRSIAVRFTPISRPRQDGLNTTLCAMATCTQPDSCTAAKKVSFDRLVRERKQLGGHVEAERLCSLEIDHELDFGWLQDRQIGGLRAFENPSDIDASL